MTFPSIPGIKLDHKEHKKDPAGVPVRFRLNVKLNYCASGQPDINEYQKMIPLLVEKGAISDASQLLVINTRKEDHCYLDGIGVEFVEEKPDQIPIIDHIQQHMSKLSFSFKTNADHDVAREENFVKDRLGAEYVNIPTPDHGTPPIRAVDDFVEILKKNPDKFIYLHCHGGKGRTSTYAAMLVIVRLQQQGGLDGTTPLKVLLKENLDEESYKKLFKVVDEPKPDELRSESPTSSDDDATWDKVQARLKFLESFYDYVANGALETNTTWAEYNARSDRNTV